MPCDQRAPRWSEARRQSNPSGQPRSRDSSTLGIKKQPNHAPAAVSAIAKSNRPELPCYRESSGLRLKWVSDSLSSHALGSHINDPSSATRPARGHACKQSAKAGFAASGLRDSKKGVQGSAMRKYRAGKSALMALV